MMTLAGSERQKRRLKAPYLRNLFTFRLAHAGKRLASLSRANRGKMNCPREVPPSGTQRNLFPHRVPRRAGNVPSLAATTFFLTLAPHLSPHLQHSRLLVRAYHARGVTGAALDNDTGEGRTNKHLAFEGQTKHLKLKFSSLASISPYADGLELQKNTASARPFFLEPLDGWFHYNVIQAS
jgi:hypothetical protein